MNKAGNSKADIVAVARAAGVSISTVSRSFNHPHLLHPATRKLIETTVQELGYIRNRAAQTMHGRRSATIGLVVPTIDHAIFAEVTQSFADALAAQGFTLMIASHGFDLDREYAMLRKFLEHRVDGLAVIGLDHSEASYQLIRQQGIPALAIWNHDPDSPIDCVGIDNEEAGKLAARHLIELGHRKIGVVFPPTGENDRARARLSGAISALAEANIVVPDALRIEAPYLIGEAKRACGEILALDSRPTALLCGNDVIAQGAIFAAKRAGLSVPEDVSIMGIGDFKGSAEFEPAISTIRIPAKRIGEMSGQQMCAAVIGNTDGIKRLICPAELLVRSTTRRVVP